MGFLDNALGDAVPGGDLTKPLMIAAAALFAYKMFGHKDAAPVAAPTTGSEGGLLGGLGNLVQKFQGTPQAPAMNSWIGAGQNQPISPAQLNATLGQQAISDLAQKSGMSEEDLLAQLSRALPEIINKLTPNGRLPTNAEIAAAAP